MADEMTPAEMRKRAEALRKLGRAVSYYGALGAVGLNDADRVAWEQTLEAGADALDDLANIQDAWTVPGPHPEWHERVKGFTRRDWPALARAIERTLP
ncbi:hypothetical protein [Microbacterium sp. gxy059]|uniref:hypothetical protein n=1 Tax=Microbacterium sp. gxy059 TaxID=2957199 RepID=UPI003D99AE2C